MGGNALKNTNTRRYSKDEFEDLELELIPKLYNIFPNSNIKVIPSVKLKKDFGDMDILISRAEYKNPKNLIQEEFNPNEIIKNSNIFSFDYKELQIDIIFVSDDDFYTAYNYFSYNDLGNLIGRLAHAMGLKYGVHGLWYNFYHNNQNKEKIIVSKDSEKIFEFLGLDWLKFKEGFNTIDDVFDYIKNSKYFNKKYFIWDNWDSEDKRRNRKRVNIMKFVKFVENLPEKEELVSKENIIELVESHFPGSKVKEKITELHKKYDLQLKVKEKFNGNIIQRFFPFLEGENLGKSIINFKEHFGSNYDDYILNTSLFEIIRDFKRINNFKRYVDESGNF